MKKETDESGYVAGGPCCSENFRGTDEHHGLRCKLKCRRRPGECLHSHCGGPCATHPTVPRSKWCEPCEAAVSALRGAPEMNTTSPAAKGTE